MDVRERLAWFRIVRASAWDGAGRSCERFAGLVTKWAGTTPAFIVAVTLIVVWLVCGPWCQWSDTWQLVINTGTSIVTFLMVFLIQATQSRDTRALHLKLDELIYAVGRARNEMIDIEGLTEEELETIAERYKKLREQCLEKRQRKQVKTPA